MDKKRVGQIKEQFDLVIHSDQEAHIEFWYARDLMPLLGYERWENFDKAIGRAIESCETSGIEVSDHFREVTKMITAGKGAQRLVKDYMLTRYACYLIAQNGDPKKEEIAFAQSYFAVQTRKQELIEERISLIERTEAEADCGNPKNGFHRIFMSVVWMTPGSDAFVRRVTGLCLAVTRRKK